MACILKPQAKNSRGVLVVTTPERDQQIFADADLRKVLEGLKDRWMVGLHHNWHDLKFKYDPLFDFSMAGEGDLVEVTGIEVPLVPLDACNFAPDCFKPADTGKFWDVLYVARAVYFKRIPEFFDCIRSLYDHGFQHRVLFICPVPPYNAKEEKTAFYKIRDVYDKMFSAAEKDTFTLLTIDYRYPFPFDLQTLAHFYRSSKVFVHTADDERRCRVAAYAWASGLPVIGMDCVGSLLPRDVRKPPYFFEAKKYADFSKCIVDAVNSPPASDWNAERMRGLFTESGTGAVLDGWLERLFQRHGLGYERGMLWSRNLGIRLGRHHNGVKGSNTLVPTLKEFLQWLSQHQAELEVMGPAEADDPERVLEAQMAPSGLSAVWSRLVARG
jgi:glycosyltransferase involved in cell wall biosynthesis